MILSTNVNDIQYALQLSVDNFIKVERKDDDVDYPLFQRLETLERVTKVDYNGHFGPFIFINVDPSETKDTLNLARDMIKQYVETCPN